jgi:hypothetical protein
LLGGGKVEGDYLEKQAKSQRLGRCVPDIQYIHEFD